MGFFKRLFGKQDKSLRQKLQTNINKAKSYVENISANQFDYKLIYSEGDNGKGYVVLQCKDQQRLMWQSLPKSEGLESIDVVGESYRMEVLQQSCFSIGSEILLLPEPNNPYDPNAVAVWDIDRRFQAGYIPREAATRIARKLTKGQIDRCIVMWETANKGKRNSIRLLLIGPKARIQTP